jgi:hypothetical protein
MTQDMFLVTDINTPSNKEQGSPREEDGGADRQPKKKEIKVGDTLLALWRPEADDWREVTIIEKKNDMFYVHWVDFNRRCACSILSETQQHEIHPTYEIRPHDNKTSSCAVHQGISTTCA